MVPVRSHQWTYHVWLITSDSSHLTFIMDVPFGLPHSFPRTRTLKDVFIYADQLSFMTFYVGHFDHLRTRDIWTHAPLILLLPLPRFDF